MTDSDETPLWLFSLKFYSLEGVRESLLACQDCSGANINIVLFMLWIAPHRRFLSLTEVREIVSLTRSWSKNVIVPLRKIRQSLKKTEEAIVAKDSVLLREKIKMLELEAEKIEQRALFEAYDIDCMGTLGLETGATAKANLKIYEQLLKAPFPEPNLEFIVETISRGLH